MQGLILRTQIAGVRVAMAARQQAVFLLMIVFSLAILVGVQGCATPPGTTKGFNDYAADTLQAADAAVSLARTLLAAQKISSEDALNVAKAAEVARDGVAVARQTAATQGSAAGTARVRLAADALDQMILYLNSKKGGA